MRLGFVIGALGRGGAELQLLRLSAGLVERGHEVSVVAYDGPAVLDGEFRAAGVHVLAERPASRAAKVTIVRRWMDGSRFDVVHAIMRRASTVALLARRLRRRPKVVASDYSSVTYGKRTATFWFSLATFALADRVVTETELNRTSLERAAPWVKRKVSVVRNGLDTERFAPSLARFEASEKVFKFCAVGTVSSIKNPLRVLDAVADLRRRGHTSFRLDWFGRDSQHADDDTGARARDRVMELGLDRHVRFHGDTPDVQQVYARADAFIHASTQEGFPNAVAEALACGLPVVLSRVSDLPRVVAAADNGYVFDELDPTSIADAMERLMALSHEERAAMGARSRTLALRWFRLERFIDEFEALYRGLREGGA